MAVTCPMTPRLPLTAALCPRSLSRRIHPSLLRPWSRYHVLAYALRQGLLRASSHAYTAPFLTRATISSQTPPSIRITPRLLASAIAVRVSGIDQPRYRNTPFTPPCTQAPAQLFPLSYPYGPNILTAGWFRSTLIASASFHPSQNSHNARNGYNFNSSRLLFHSNMSRRASFERWGVRGFRTGATSLQTTWTSHSCALHALCRFFGYLTICVEQLTKHYPARRADPNPNLASGRQRRAYSCIRDRSDGGRTRSGLLHRLGSSSSRHPEDS